MKKNIILYMPGYAGNFLARLFSLGDETMPQLPIDLLNHMSLTGQLIPVVDRTELYSFKKVPESFDDWQLFHRAWADFYQNSKFELLNVFYNSKASMVYGIHPAEFIAFKDTIDQLDCVDFYYVDLDLALYGQWVEDQQKKLKFVVREQEPETFQILVHDYHMKPISLTKMLDSEEHFIQEYTRVCALMSMIPRESLAVKLYNDWRSVRRS